MVEHLFEAQGVVSSILASSTFLHLPLRGGRTTVDGRWYVYVVEVTAFMQSRAESKSAVMFLFE